MTCFPYHRNSRLDKARSTAAARPSIASIFRFLLVGYLEWIPLRGVKLRTVRGLQIIPDRLLLYPPFGAVLTACIWLSFGLAAQAEPTAPPVPVVGVTLATQGYFVKRLVGTAVHLEVLLPPGSNHEMFEPSLGQITRLQSAQLYFAVGHPRLTLEQAWIPRLRALASTIRIIDTTQHSRGDDPDDHIWLSFVGAKEMVVTMAESLEELLPERRQQTAEQLTKLEQEIDKLHDQSVATIGQTPITYLAYHPSWSHLARELSLHQLVVESEGKEAGLVAASKVIKEAKLLGLKVILAEPSSPQRPLEYLRSSLGAEVITIDPVGEDWFAIVRSFVDAAVRSGNGEHR